MFTLAKNKVMQGCGSGAITPQDYLGILDRIMKKDQVLAAFFNKMKDKSAQA
jgi:hypothetical protein